MRTTVHPWSDPVALQDRSTGKLAITRTPHETIEAGGPAIRAQA